jgi:hypothetical protein
MQAERNPTGPTITYRWATDTAKRVYQDTDGSEILYATIDCTPAQADDIVAALNASAPAPDDEITIRLTIDEAEAIVDPLTPRSAEALALGRAIRVAVQDLL